MKPVERLINKYKRHFSVIVTLLAVIMLAAIANHLPYFNLASYFFSTLILTLGLFFLVINLGNTWRWQLKILVGLVILAAVFDVFDFGYLSEMSGNLFYIFLFYVILKEVVNHAVSKK